MGGFAILFDRAVLSYPISFNPALMLANGTIPLPLPLKSPSQMQVKPHFPFNCTTKHKSKTLPLPFKSHFQMQVQNTPFRSGQVWEHAPEQRVAASTTPQHHSDTLSRNLTREYYPVVSLLSSKIGGPEGFAPIPSSGELPCEGKLHRRYSHRVGFQITCQARPH